MGAQPKESRRPDAHGLVGTVAFAVAFPGFFAYHTLVDRGFLPRFLGGYSTAAAVGLLPFLALEYRRRVLRPGGLPRFDGAFLGFLAYFALVTLGHVVAGASPETTTSHASSILQFLALYLLTRVIDVQSASFRWTLLASFALATGLVFWNASGESLLLATLDFTVKDDRSPDYQGYGLVYMVLLLYVAATVRRGWIRAACYAVAAPALFLNGARSEFAALFLGVATVEFCRSRRRIAVAFAGLGAAALGFTAVVVLGEALGEALPASRVLSLATGQADDSALERLRYFRRAWDTVAAHPFLGSFASYPPGEYAHNFLSVWVDLGLVGFLAFAALLLLPLGVLLVHFREASREESYMLALEATLILVVLAAFAKDFTYRLFPVAMALYASWRDGLAPAGEASGPPAPACQANRMP